MTTPPRQPTASDANRLKPVLSFLASDMVWVSVLTLVAAGLRLWRIESIPPGLHGDEAWTGLDAVRILKEGWIGPYVPSALGQPTGPLYFAAPFVALLGHTILSVRLPMAVLGILTIPATWLMTRAMFDRVAAYFAAILLTFMLWHLHFSRIAFMVISWPLAEVVALACLWRGLRTGRTRWFALAGAALGLGVYTYNAYPVFLAGLCLTVPWLLFGAGAWNGPGKRSVRLRWRVGQLALFGAAALAVASLLIVYWVRHPEICQHHRLVSVFGKPNWIRADGPGRLHILWNEWFGFVRGLGWGVENDGADGTGDRPMLSAPFALLVAAGLCLCAWRVRRAEYAVLAILCLSMTAGPAITELGSRRRSFGMTPFLVVAAALPLALFWRMALRGAARRARNWIVRPVLVALVAWMAFLDLSFYFGPFPKSGLARFVFCDSLTAASEKMAEMPGKPYVLFFSGRWCLRYETCRWLLPDMEGEDRSRQFGRYGIEPPPDRTDILWVFLDPYLPVAAEVVRRYPGGERIELRSGADNRLMCILYRARV